MLQNESLVIIADNTGAKIGKIFRILKGSQNNDARVGDRVVVAVRSANTNSSFNKGDVVRAVVVRTKKEMGRKDGSFIRFADNAVALIDKEDKPLGKRIFGPVAKELREKGFKDIANLAEEVI